MSTVRSQSDGSTSATDRGFVLIPALLTRSPTSPNARAPWRPLPAPDLDRKRHTPSGIPDRHRAHQRRRARRQGDVPTWTRAPASARVWTTARPIPVPAPVTTATVPSSLSSRLTRLQLLSALASSRSFVKCVERKAPRHHAVARCSRAIAKRSANQLSRHLALC